MLENCLDESICSNSERLGKINQSGEMVLVDEIEKKTQNAKRRWAFQKTNHHLPNGEGRKLEFHPESNVTFRESALPWLPSLTTPPCAFVTLRVEHGVNAACCIARDWEKKKKRPQRRGNTEKRTF